MTDFNTGQLSSMYDRQAALPIQPPNTVALIGCGGVGTWVGFFLALAGVPNLILFDSDTVSTSNLNRTPHAPDMISKPKTEALATLISRVRPDCKVTCYPHFAPDFADALHLGNIDWVVATTDTWDSRRKAAGWAVNHANTSTEHTLPTFTTQYIEASAEGDTGSIAGSPADFATEDETKPGYASVPVWIGPAAAAAVLACSHILHGEIRTDDSARLGWCPEHNQVTFTDTYPKPQEPSEDADGEEEEEDESDGLEIGNPAVETPTSADGGGEPPTVVDFIQRARRDTAWVRIPPGATQTLGTARQEPGRIIEPERSEPNGG